MISSATTGFASSWTSTAINAWYTMPLGGANCYIYSLAPLIDFLVLLLLDTIQTDNYE